MSDAERQPSPDESGSGDPLYAMAVDSARAILDGINQQSMQAASQLVGTMHFMMKIGSAFGGKFEYIDDPDGELGKNGKPIQLIALVDSITGERIDLNVIMERINFLISNFKEKSKDTRHDGDLTEEDL